MDNPQAELLILWILTQIADREDDDQRLRTAAAGLALISGDHPFAETFGTYLDGGGSHTSG